MEMIYHSRKEALEACKQYVEKVKELQRQTGVWETLDDDCVGVTMRAQYMNDGKIEEALYCP